MVAAAAAAPQRHRRRRRLLLRPWAAGGPAAALLLLLFLLLQEVRLATSAHSLRHFYTAVWEPGQGVPQFIAMGYVDGQPIDRYDSDSRKKVPSVPWMNRVEEHDPEYWQWNTQRTWNAEQRFRGDLVTLRKHHNESGGPYTWQHMFGCELGADGQKRAFSQYSYDGRDFLTFDKETLTWTASDPTALVFKRKLDANVDYSHYVKAYQEETCVLWLRRFLEYGKEDLLRSELPTVTVTHKTGYDGQETLICRVHGFYPKEIDASWRRKGENWAHATFHGKVAPNSDGTYCLWLSIDIHPKERGLYRCHVEHDSLLEPLDVAWEGPGLSPLQFYLLLALGTLGGGLIVTVLLVAGLIAYINRRRQDGYRKAASERDKGSGSSFSAV